MAGNGGCLLRRQTGESEVEEEAAARRRQGQRQGWYMRFSAETDVVFRERVSKFMFRFRTSSLVVRVGEGRSNNSLTENIVTGHMRALKRGARGLGRQLRRHSARSLCCVSRSARSIGYHKLSRSSSLDRVGDGYLDAIPSSISPFIEWPAWSSLGRLTSLQPPSSFTCLEKDDTVVVKINYVASQKNEDYVQTVGVRSMEKIFRVQNANIALSIWDVGGHCQFSSMMPLVCKGSDAVLITFDLTRRSTLYSVKQWFMQVRHCNKSAIVILVGTKYDQFVNLPQDTQRVITRQARSYAQAMDASLFFSSVTHDINVHKIFKVIMTKLFDLPCNIPKNLSLGEPIIDY